MTSFPRLVALDEPVTAVVKRILIVKKIPSAAKAVAMAVTDVMAAEMTASAAVEVM